MDRRRLDVKQAAQVLGVSTDAIHKRVRRGTLDSDKDEDGRVYVYLDHDLADDLDDGYMTDRRDAHVDSLEDQIQFLRRELERKDTIIMTMAQRIPELEAPGETREAPVTVSEGPGEGEARPKPQEPPQRRSRLYRLFFGPWRQPTP